MNLLAKSQQKGKMSLSTSVEIAWVSVPLAVPAEAAKNVLATMASYALSQVKDIQ